MNKYKDEIGDHEDDDEDDVINDDVDDEIPKPQRRVTRGFSEVARPPTPPNASHLMKGSSPPYPWGPTPQNTPAQFGTPKFGTSTPSPKFGTPTRYGSGTPTKYGTPTKCGTPTQFDGSPQS